MADDGYLNAHDIATIIDRDVKTSGSDFWVRCPAHDDNSPSLCITNGKIRTLFYCAAGCSQGNILDALAQKHGINSRRFLCDPAKAGEAPTRAAHTASAQSPVSKEPKQPPPVYAGGRPDIPEPRHFDIVHPQNYIFQKSWRWHDPDGRLMAVTARFNDLNGGKDILPFTPWVYPQDPNRIRWRAKAPPGDNLFYDLHTDDTISPILIVEGEKCAEACKAMLTRPLELFDNQVPWITTILGGGRKVGRTNLNKLRGRHVTVMQDMDKPGLLYAAAFAHADVASLSLLRIPAMPPRIPVVTEGFDVADMNEAGVSFAALESVARNKFIKLTLK